MNRRLAEAQERHGNLCLALESILNAAHDGDRDFTEAESAEMTSIQDRMKALETRIAMEQNLANVERGAPRGNQIQIPKPNENPKFSSFGEQMQCVMRAAHPSTRVIDKRLEVAAGGIGMNEQSQSDGGFLVQPEFATDVLRRSFDTGQLAKRCRRRQLGENSNRFIQRRIKDALRTNGYRGGAITLYWTDEGGLKVASGVKWGNVEIPLHKLIGLTYITDELLQDVVQLEETISSDFADEFGFVLDDAIIRGTGAGMPLGILNSSALVTVSKVQDQTADTVNYTNIIAMYTAFYSKGKSSASAVWLVTPAVMAQLMVMTLGGTSTVFGAPVFLPANGASGKPYATMLGIPILECEQCSAIGDVGDILLVDLQEYLIIDKTNGRIKSDSSMHVRYIYDETTLRWVYRVGGGPRWDAPTTPYKGAISQSPFVALEAR